MAPASRYASYDGKYDPAEDQEWAADILKLPASKSGERWRFRGPCPRCGHDIDIVVELGAGQARPGGAPAAPVEAIRRYARGPRERTITQTVFCNCSQPHEQRDKSDTGCGISGNLNVQLRRS